MTGNGDGNRWGRQTGTAEVRGQVLWEQVGQLTGVRERAQNDTNGEGTMGPGCHPPAGGCCVPVPAGSVAGAPVPGPAGSLAAPPGAAAAPAEPPSRPPVWHSARKGCQWLSGQSSHPLAVSALSTHTSLHLDEPATLGLHNPRLSSHLCRQPHRVLSQLQGQGPGTQITGASHS